MTSEKAGQHQSIVLSSLSFLKTEDTFSYPTEVEPDLNSNCCSFPKPTYIMAGETENYVPELSGKLKENMKWINT